MADDSELVYKPITNETYRRLIERFVPDCNFKTGFWIAGGSVRKVWFDLPWEDQDIDLFFASETQFQLTKTNLVGKLPKSEPVSLSLFDFNVTEALPVKMSSVSEYETANAVTYTVYTDSEFDHKPFKIQAIKRYFVNNINELFDSFDFTVTQFATDGKIMVTTRQALQDCEQKRLQMIPETSRPINALRTIKYTAYGFEPVDELMRDVVSALANGDEVMIADDY